MNDIVASKIKDFRKGKGFTSEYVADKLGVSKGSYSNLENGKIEITITKLELISKVFNHPIENFLPTGQTVNQISHGTGSNIGKIDTQNNYSESNLMEVMRETISKLDYFISKSEIR